MSQYLTEIAGGQNDKELRDILKSIPMSGHISLCFEKEPSFLRALQIEGEHNQVGVVRERSKNMIVGFAARSIRCAYLNGKAENLGYISNLRIIDGYRNSRVLAEGYRFYRQMHKDGLARIYVSTIMSDNKMAIGLLTSKRAGLPDYQDVGEYQTSIIARGRKKAKQQKQYRIVSGHREMLKDIVSFLREEGSKKQFYPFYSEEEFLGDNDRLMGLNVENVYIALKDEKIVGVIAKWDQNGFKQTRVAGYSGMFGAIRPFYNMYAKIMGYPLLPKPGQNLNFFYVSCIVVKDNEPGIFSELLGRLYDDFVGTNHPFFVVGLHSKDMLLHSLKAYRRFTIKSRLYVVHFQDGEESFRGLDERVPYLEAATL
jgi:hypothetical protein